MMNDRPGSCGHPVVRVPELEDRERGETVVWCGTCRRHYSSRAFDLVGLIAFLSSLVGIAALVAWLVLEGVR